MSESTRGATPSRFAATLRALRHRNYQLYFSGQFISVIGTWMQMVAQSWLVYRLTGSSVLLGAVGFSGQFPIFVFSALGGHVADRYNRHRVVIATQTASMILAFIFAALVLSKSIQVWHVFILASLLGMVNGFDIPARQALAVQMVGREDLMNAIALNSSIFNVARIIGPAIAGILVASIGEGWCFFSNGVSFVAVIIGLLLMKLPKATHPVHHEPALHKILEGFRYCAGTGPFRLLLFLLSVASIASMSYVVLMPIFAAQILHGGPRSLGILMSGAGIGAIIGVLTLASRTQVKGLERWVMVCCIGLGIGVVLFAWSRVFWLSVLLLVPVGGCTQVNMASINTLLQAMVPDRLRGRVMSVYSMMWIGIAPFGSLLGGFLASKLGAPTSVTITGSIAIFGALAYGMLLPGVLPDLHQLIVAQGIGVAQPAGEPEDLASPVAE